MKLEQLDPIRRIEAFDYAIDLVKKNLEYNPNDGLTLTTLARLQITALKLTKHSKYLNDSKQSIDKAIAVSGEHIPPYIIKINILMAASDWSGAKEAVIRSQKFFPKYPDLYCYSAKVDFLSENVSDDTYDNLDQCLITPRGQQIIGTGDYLSLIEKHYADQNDFVRLAMVYELQLAKNKTDAKLWDKLYDTYQKAGKPDMAEASRAAQQEVVKSLK